MAIGSSGAIFTANFSSGSISRVDPTTGTSATIITGVDWPQTDSEPRWKGLIAVTSTGVIYATTKDSIAANLVASAEVSAAVTPSAATTGDAVTLDLTGLPTGVVIDDSTVQSVWWGDDTVAFTSNAGTNTVTVNVPPGSGSVPLVLSLNGGNAVSAGNFTYATSPVPPAPIPSNSPAKVSASPGEASASISWQEPSSSGSFPVTHYQAVGSPSGSCLVAAPELSCEVSGLRNGQEYSFRVRALTGAGWGSWSVPVSVTPVAPAPSMLITGSRDGVEVVVEGVMTGMPREQVTPWVRFPGPHSYEPQPVVRSVSAAGDFTWRRETNKKTYVFFRAGDDVRSNRVIIPAR